MVILAHMKQGAFTLIELMVVLAVLGILTAVVVPNLQSLNQNIGNTTQTNDFVSSLNYTRSEAITRGIPVKMCKSNNGTSCGNDGVFWHDGWIIFTDLDNNNVWNDGAEELLRVYDGFNSDEYTLDGNGTVNTSVTYNSNGSSQSGSFILCDSRGLGEHAKAIEISFGRIRTTKQTDPTLPDSVKNAADCIF